MEEGGGNQKEEEVLPPLPEGWTEIEAQDDVSIYYFNEAENKTQWTHPALGEDEVRGGASWYLNKCSFVC